MAFLAGQIAPSLERSDGSLSAGIEQKLPLRSALADRFRGRMDRMREENRRLFGESEIGVDLIREIGRPMTRPVTWYRANLNLTTQEYGVVELERALSIIRRCAADRKPFYETFEEAHSQTMVGFSKSANEFIELIFYTDDQIHLRFELPSLESGWIYSLFQRPFEYTETACSLQAAEDRVREFFSLTAAELRLILG
jgi:hypothetical protein